MMARQRVFFVPVFAGVLQVSVDSREPKLFATMTVTTWRLAVSLNGPAL